MSQIRKSVKETICTIFKKKKKKMAVIAATLEIQFMYTVQTLYRRTMYTGIRTNTGRFQNLK